MCNSRRKDDKYTNRPAQKIVWAAAFEPTEVSEYFERAAP